MIFLERYPYSRFEKRQLQFFLPLKLGLRGSSKFFVFLVIIFSLMFSFCFILLFNQKRGSGNVKRLLPRWMVPNMANKISFDVFCFFITALCVCHKNNDSRNTKEKNKVVTNER